jgi:isochorismate hydrolase
MKEKILEIVSFGIEPERAELLVQQILDLFAPIYSQDEVKSLIQSIYSEFAELPSKMHTTNNLRIIITQEVELHPLKPIKIFK